MTGLRGLMDIRAVGSLVGLTALGCGGDQRAPATAAAPATAVAVAVAPASSFPFPLPFVSDTRCDYCQDPVTICRAVVARAEPDTTAAPVFPLMPGDPVALVDTMRTYVDRPDLLVFTDSFPVAEVSKYHTSSPAVDSIVFEPGDSVFVLTYGWEGAEGDWWYRGRMWRSDNAWMDPANVPFTDPLSADRVATHSNSRQSRSWIQVRHPDGRRGWLEDQDTLVVYASYYDVEPRRCGEPG